MPLRDPIKGVLFHAAWSAVAALLALYFPMADGLENLFGLESPTGQLSGVIAFLLVALGALLSVISAVVVGVIWIFKGRFSRVGLAILGYATVIIISTFCGLILDSQLDRLAERRLADEGRLLTAAIAAFTAERGWPPEQLDDLQPSFLVEIPPTGLSLYPRFEIVTCAGDKQKCFGDDWTLHAYAIESKILMRGSGGCDGFVFAPSGRYPTAGIDTICHYGEAVDGWVYEYGD
jgi:hypothetical protein